MESNMQSLQAKQNYLHYEIIEKEYDPQEFQQFMVNQKGLNLDDYTMKQLKRIVKVFKGLADGIQIDQLNNTNETDQVQEQNNIQYEIQFPQQHSDSNLDPNFSQKQKQSNDKLSIQNGDNKNLPKQSQNKRIQNGKKVGIDLKKMIIPQFKAQGTIENQQIKKCDNLNESKTQNKGKNDSRILQQKAHPLKHNPNSQKSSSNKIDLDEYQREIQKAFISQDSSIQQGSSSKKKEHIHQYNQRATESFYIPSSNTKLPFVISTKLTTSSLFKEIKSFTRIDKDGRQWNEFFDSFSIKIKSFAKKQSNSLFKFPYVTYQVETSIGTKKQQDFKKNKQSSSKNTPEQSKTRVWKVQRRFNDFSWLHDYMQKNYFGTPVPPIPAKTKMRSFDDGHLQERMIIFERFLNKCVHIDEIASDPVLQGFLSIQSREQLQAVKKKFGDKLKNRDQNNMQFLKGDEILNYSKGISSISHNTKAFFIKSSQLLSTLNEQLVTLQQNLKMASQSAVMVSNTFRELSQLYKSNYEYQIRGSALFDVASQYIGDLSYKIDNQTYYLKNYVSNSWTYEQLYQKNILSYLQSLDKHRSILETKFKDLHLSKSTQMSTNASFAETKNISVNAKTTQLYKKTKQLYEVNLSLAIQQIRRHLQQDLLTLSKQFSTGIGKYVEKVKEQMMTGVDLMTKAMTVAEGKQLKQVQLLSKHLMKRKDSQKIQLSGQ